MNKILKTLISLVLLVVIGGLVWLIVNSVMEPVNFNKAKDAREVVAVQRLKDIRELQVAYKSVNGKFASTLDSLCDFYNNGKMEIVMQIGSKDDSLAMANTEKVKKANPRLKGDELNKKLYELYQQGQQSLVFDIKTPVAVKDTIFNSRKNFVVDSLKYIPFSGGEQIQMESVVKLVSGVNVPLFEARIPYKLLLKGLDNQLRINLDAERRTQNRYEGLQVGSVTTPNNNAGNWE